MRLNLQKCAFEVEVGKFLSFVLTHRGIKANLSKCKAILKMKSSSSIKEVQCLTGQIASLSQFLAAAFA